MKFKKQSPLHVVLLCLILIFQFSCSKDSDLLTDYVLADTSISKDIANLVVDDTYQISLSGSMVLDVLANDTFENEAEVAIIETSTPTNGTVAINSDDTLTYTPNAEIIEQVSDTTETAVDEVDTFTYTVEVDNGEGTATTEEASVVITTGDNAAREDAVSLQTYGAVGDGVTDDTAAIQNALDNETSITSDASKTYLISSTLNIDQNMAQTIDFNGSTITRKSKVHWMLNIDKRNYANSLTTIENLILDGNNKGGSVVDIASRTNMTNVEIKDVIHNNANGIRVLTYNAVGMYGESVFDNVDIHNIKPVGNDGQYGNDLGAAHAFIASASQIPTSEVKIVYINSDIYEIWGEDAGGISLFSAGLDISYSPLSYWFENVNVSDAQRRAVKGFCGNQTWINCTFTSAAYDDPNIIRTMPSAGLFVIGPGSSSTGGENNVICGCTFQGHPDDPFDSFYTRVIMTGDLGPAGLKISNSTFTGANPQSHPDNGFTAFGSKLQYLSIDNSTFGTQNGIRLVGAFDDYVNMSTNNTFVDGKTTTFSRTTVSYTEPSIPYEACPSILD